MKPDIRLTLIIIAANLAINVGGVAAYNAMRQIAMDRAATDRALIQHRLDDAWNQRERLAAATVRACQK